MSDSIKKYYELVEDGKIDTYNKTVSTYTELELAETVVNIARHYKEAQAGLVLKMAKDELNAKKST